MTEENRLPKYAKEVIPSPPIPVCRPPRSLKTTLLIIILPSALCGLIILGLLVAAFEKAQEAARRLDCANETAQIGLSLFQYAGDHDDYFPDLVDPSGNLVPTVGILPTQPARTGFLILLKEGYLTTTKVFICPSSTDRVNEQFPTDYKNASLRSLVQAFGESNCSYGWDPTKKHSADPTCAIIADNPPRNVSQANEGTAKNNSENHRGEGQAVFYNDGHWKWGATPKPDSSVYAEDDPDIYTGAPGYEKSTTDAKIIR